MNFYSSIYTYYDSLFPLNRAQVDFVNRQNYSEKLSLLDVGCGTGSLAIELAKEGHRVSAIDLDPFMIEEAKRKAGRLSVDFSVMDMLTISETFPAGQFDAVLCFGNTLVHLSGKEHIANFFQSVFKILKQGGKFLLQILNYDFILNEKVSVLPLIENEQVRFIREYEFLPGGAVLFHTNLLVKDEGREVKNRVALFPLRKDELHEMLINAGFTSLDFYSSFDRESFQSENLPLIVKAEK